MGSIFKFSRKQKEECAHFHGYANWPEFQRAFPGDWALDELKEYVDKQDDQDKQDGS